jgi:hypothetical protein
MRSRDLIDQILKADPGGDAHVEVLEHDGSWAWISEASLLTLNDAEGPTNTVVLQVANSGVRQQIQPLGRPPSSMPVSHVPTIQDWAKMKERYHDQEDAAD